MKNTFRAVLFIFAALVLAAPEGLVAEVNPYAGCPDELKPSDIVILANSDAPESVALAEYYAEKRSIPKENIVALPMPQTEVISWDVYVRSIEEPLHAWLTKNGWLKETAVRKDEFGRTHGIVLNNRAGYVVICQGVPLKIAEEPRFATAGNQSDFMFIVHVKRGTQMSGILLHSYASVDSELAAMPAEINPVFGFIPNLLYNKTRFDGRVMNSIIRTSRLGGPDYAAARSLVDSAIAAEKSGVQGRVYIDKGGPFPMAEAWLDGAADGFVHAGWDAEIDRDKTTFKPGARFDAPAFYFGWYSASADGPFLEPGMRFPAGAIAAHLYSFSANTLADRKQWCAALIERGAAGTVGNVNEPALEFTHNFEIIAKAMLGGWSFCDAAWSSMPVLSWQGVIFGDPLYKPMPWMAEGSQASRPVGEYPAVSGILSLEAAGKRSDALAAAGRAAGDTHGFAISLKYAQMLHAAARDAESGNALLFMANAGDMTPDQRSVALEAARLLYSMHSYGDALAILENLRSANASVAFRAVVVGLGYEIAQKSGRAEFIGRWQKDKPAAN
jgi:uncharacterized protein (TIGR03790 family)